MSTQLHMRSTTLYEYLIMLVFIFGGGAMVLKVLCNPKYRDDDNRHTDFDYEEELEKIRRNRK